MLPPRVAQEAETQSPTAEEHLPTNNWIPSIREAAKQTSPAFSGVPFGVSSSCLGEEEAGEEGSLLSRSLWTSLLLGSFRVRFSSLMLA